MSELTAKTKAHLVNRYRLRRLVHLLGKLSPAEGAWLLSLYGKYNRFFFCGESKLTDIEDIIRIVQKTGQIKHLCDFRVCFYGGPGTNIQMYRGHLGTFIAEIVLDAYRKRGIEWKWLFHFQPGNYGSIDEQLASYIPDELNIGR